MIGNPYCTPPVFGTLSDGTDPIQPLSWVFISVSHFLRSERELRRCADSQEQFPLKYHRRVLHINTQMNSDYSLCV